MPIRERAGEGLDKLAVAAVQCISAGRSVVLALRAIRPWTDGPWAPRWRREIPLAGLFVFLGEGGARGCDRCWISCLRRKDGISGSFQRRPFSIQKMKRAHCSGA